VLNGQSTRVLVFVFASVSYQHPLVLSIVLTSIDRLPTVSASEALQKLRDAAPKNISTGLPTLNAILTGQPRSNANGGSRAGGLVPGQITEVYGPPGVGKTAFWYVNLLWKVRS
jgi:hypothetical protein